MLQGTKEFEIMRFAFESAAKSLHCNRLDREKISEVGGKHEHKAFYKDGTTNALFLAFASGYSAGQLEERLNS